MTKDRGVQLRLRPGVGQEARPERPDFRQSSLPLEDPREGGLLPAEHEQAVTSIARGTPEKPGDRGDYARVDTTNIPHEAADAASVRRSARPLPRRVQTSVNSSASRCEHAKVWPLEIEQGAAAGNPSPLVGEGDFAKRSRVRGPSLTFEHSPSPGSQVLATLSHEGRGKKNDRLRWATLPTQERGRDYPRTPTALPRIFRWTAQLQPGGCDATSLAGAAAGASALRADTGSLPGM